MKRLAFTFFVLAVVTTQPVAQTQSTQRNVDRPSPISPIRSMLDTYCIGCHGSTVRAGGVAFAGMPLDAIGNNAEVWEKAVRKLRAA